MEKKLEVKNLTISFRTQGGKVQAVRDVSFDLYKGETLAIVGESGSGKSVTNRAIMGILAGNAIVENGKIIYDGRDLLKITEEEFVKLRGDKIAMIFQDPLSSLDPIMKIGKQITEAMLLKNKATRRAGKREFNSTLALLKEDMIASFGGGSEEKEKISNLTKEFDSFCIESDKLETAYNEARTIAQETLEYIEDVIFKVERKQKLDCRVVYRKVRSDLKRMRNDFLTYHFEKRIAFAQSDLAVKLKVFVAQKGRHLDIEMLEPLKEVNIFINEILSQEKPNFFRIGYYVLKHPTEDVKTLDTAELNKIALEYLDKNFMNDFIEFSIGALKYSAQKSGENKKIVIEEIDKYITGFGDILQKKYAYAMHKNLSAIVAKSIDRLEIVKDSFAYTFSSTLKNELDKYFYGVSHNPKEEKRFTRQTAKREKLLSKGKQVDWKVVPAAMVDLEIQKKNILDVLSDLKAKYKKDIDDLGSVDFHAKAIALIDFFKEKASQYVYKITRKIARAKALKLMEEVGIPESRIRYNQYPFEFSGGMRQRIVIAIALAANPDILICDEPTTALDVTIQAQILELINKLKKERNLSVIFITHDLGVVANMADRIAVMYAGKIVETGTAEDVFYDPRHPYTWALLSSMPDLDTNDKLDAIPGTPPNMIYPPKGDAFAERNKYAMEIDYEMQPPDFKISDTHYAATWLLHPNAPKVEMPEIIKKRIAKMKQKAKENADGKEKNTNEPPTKKTVRRTTKNTNSNKKSRTKTSGKSSGTGGRK